MAHRQVALLRGINVGGAKRIAMADLRALFEKLGYRDVRTLLNSGNVTFTNSLATAHDARRIEKALVDTLGVSSRVTVLTAEELAEIVADNPLLDICDNPSRLMVAVFNDPADCSKLDAVRKQDWGSEALAIGKRVAYHWCPQGIIESSLAQAVGRALGDAVTTRNWATMLKLHALTNS